MGDLTASELIDALDELGFDVRPYSGKGMYGLSCVGIEFEDYGDLWRLSSDLSQMGHEVPAPRSDSLGTRLIAYWPRFKMGSE
jgi:hypothetical protein